MDDLNNNETKIENVQENKPEKPQEQPQKKNTKILWVVGIVILLIGAFTGGYALSKASITGNVVEDISSGSELSEPSQGSAEAIEYEEGIAYIDLYAMSQCPYGVQAENEIAKVKEKLGDKVHINIEYIGMEQNGQFQSLHGEPEIEGNTIQLCAKKQDSQKMVKFVQCQNKNPQDFKGTIEECAEEAGLDSEAIKTCSEGEEGKELLRESFAKATKAKATASPTIYINGEKYNGQRDQLSLTRAACNYAESSECEGIPECATDVDCVAEKDKEGYCENAGTEEAKCVYKDPVPFTITIINDKECKNCDTAQIETALTQYFMGATIEQKDVAEAAELIEANNIDTVPAILFEKEVEESKTWKLNKQLVAAFDETDYGYKMKDEVTGASYIIDEEKKQEMLKKLNLGDKPQVDFFVMSYCPYGNDAEEAIKPAYDKLKDEVEFKPRYVVYSNYGGPEYCFDEEQKYCSLHGVTELNQNLRELCVKDLYEMDKWFEFAIEMNTKCTYKNADTCWTDVAEGMGINVEDVEKCFTENAEEYLAEDLDLNKAFGITGSPTVLINGERYNGGRSAEGFMKALCDQFEEKPEACNDLSDLPSAKQTNAGACGV